MGIYMILDAIHEMCSSHMKVELSKPKLDLMHQWEVRKAKNEQHKEIEEEHEEKEEQQWSPLEINGSAFMMYPNNFWKETWLKQNAMNNVTAWTISKNDLSTDEILGELSVVLLLFIFTAAKHNCRSNTN